VPSGNKQHCPAVENTLGGEISANVILGKKYEKAKRKKAENVEEKGRKGKEKGRKGKEN
jgi:hypothetical protein